MKIARIEVIPVAFPDPPLLNAFGVHEPMALRTLLRLELDNGVIGWGEGLLGILPDIGNQRLNEALRGVDVTATRHIFTILRALAGEVSVQDFMRAYSILEVACLDATGRGLGVNVVDLLGGPVRDRVEFSAYLFYKWANHPGQTADEWGAAMDPAGMVAQAQRMIDLYGFRSLKLKGGIYPPDQEIAAVRALRSAFPDHPLRIDPNGAWTVETAIWVAHELEGTLEYLEDPVLGIDGMAQVRARSGAILATNMCVVETSHVKEGFDKDAVQVVLADHHYWGGLRRTQELAAICEAFGVGVSMHSNSHLGISLAAMTLVGSTVPNLAYACDTHYPWNQEYDIVPAGTFTFKEGFLALPTGAGLGVEVTESRVEELRENYRRMGSFGLGEERHLQTAERNDTGYMQKFVPGFDGTIPRY